MMNRRSILGILPVGVALAALPISASRAATPAVDTIKSFYDTLLSVMQQAKALGLKGRYEKLDPAIHRAFNLPLMTRLSVGPDWQKLSPEEQKSLTAAFSDLSVSTYAARFDGYSGEHFDVDPNPAPTSGGVIVNTKLVQSNGEPVQLNYLMRDGDAGWQILDVFLKGTVSELATRRSEFSTVLRRDGAQALVQLIQTRAADLKKSA
ncbi:MAG TPA: ABC transporter substrate-binding protein [Stellaceae bacterium]|jgi:phospholipid transport system substrate-binding protein|nr:ABC transporter substrate-binding protein [Stellaceae bacterium]